MDFLFRFTLYPVCSRVGRGSAVLRHFAIHFTLNSRSTSTPRHQSEEMKILINVENYIENGYYYTYINSKSTGCGFDPHSRKWHIYLHLYIHFFPLVASQSTALSSATQHAIPPKFKRKWETECLNTRFYLLTLLCAGYSVKLIFSLDFIY